MTNGDNEDWGFLREPVLWSPAVGFLTFAAVEFVKSPSTEGNLLEGLIWIPLFLVITTLFALIPLVIGAAGLMAVFRVLPKRLVRIVPLRLTIGGLIGALVGWPFTQVLNWIPSASAEPRFNHTSMLVACVVTGAYCAAFYSRSRAAESAVP